MYSWLLTLTFACATKAPIDHRFPDTFEPSEKFKASIEIEAISADRINEDFSNIEDLSWIAEPAKQAHAILLGEGHFSAVSQRIIGRLIFAINQHEHYPLVALEYPYSMSPFLDHYVQLEDDGEADLFMREELKRLLLIGDHQLFLEDARRWNLQHPDRKIHVVADDVEHLWFWVMDTTVRPYCAAISDADNGEPIDAMNMSSEKALEILDACEAALPQAKQDDHVGRYDFIDADYIATVLVNIRDTLAPNGRKTAIYRNMTSPNFLGDMVRQDKVIFWQGAFHTISKQCERGAFSITEGCKLSTEFAPTKNRTYAISVSDLSSHLGSFADMDVQACREQQEVDHEPYWRPITAAKQAYDEGRLGRDEPFNYYHLPVKQDWSLLWLGQELGGPYRVLSHDLENFPPTKLFKRNEWEAMINADTIIGHDTFILVPTSEPTKPFCD